MALIPTLLRLDDSILETTLCLSNTFIFLPRLSSSFLLLVTLDPEVVRKLICGWALDLILQEEVPIGRVRLTGTSGPAFPVMEKPWREEGFATGAT